MEQELFTQGGVALLGASCRDVASLRSCSTIASDLAACRLRADSRLLRGRSQNSPGRKFSRSSPNASCSCVPFFSRLYPGRSAAWPTTRKSGGITFVHRHLHSGDFVARRLFRSGTIYKGFPSNVRDAAGQLSAPESPFSAQRRCCILTRHSGPLQESIGKTWPIQCSSVRQELYRRFRSHSPY